MDLHLECPVCEQQFSTPAIPADQKITCPGCARVFPRSAAATVQPKRQSNQRSRSNRLDVPPASAEKLEMTSATRSSLTLNRIQRKRKRLVRTIATFSILGATIGVLIGLLYSQLNKTLDKPAVQLANDRPPATNPPADLNVVESDQPPVVVPAWVPPDVLAPQTLVDWDRQQVKEQWLTARPHLVSLKVFDGLGEHDAVGTIVDSRGWILTSYSGIRGASKIEVRAGVDTVQDLKDTDRLTDLVRGYVAVNQVDDLVLLAINRRFIIALTFLELASNNRIVEGQPLLQCAPPSEHNLYGVSEAKVVARGGFAQLDGVAQKLATAQQTTGSELTWLTTQSSTRPTPGTPAFDREGKLVAINSFSAPTNKSGDPKAYFVPVTSVDAMLKATSGEIKNLRELGGDTAAGITGVSTTHEMHETSVRLNQQALACEAFDWIPQSHDDFDTLQSFAATFMEIEEFARPRAASKISEEQKILAQYQHYDSLLQSRFSNLPADEQAQLASFNEGLAKRQLRKPSQVVPFWGAVDSVLFSQQQLKIQLVETKHEIKVPISTNSNPLPLESKWLFFVKTGPPSSQPSSSWVLHFGNGEK
ncbi:MAG: hypothetical protein ACI87E_002966 [Mariniblastus sp.]|jgi:hypothetical protein